MLQTHNGFLLLSRTYPMEYRCKFFFTLRDLQRQAILGDYAVKATLVVEDDAPVWEAQQ